MSITADPQHKNAWLVDTGVKQYDYEGWMGLTENGVIGPIDQPGTPTQDQHNQSLRLKALQASPAFQWLAGRPDITPIYDTEILRIGWGNTARITIENDDHAKQFDDWLNQQH